MVMIGGSFKSRFGAVLLGGASLLLASVPGIAGGLKDEVIPGDKLEVAGWVGVTSDYVFRGLSFNRREPTPQAQIDLTYGLFYAGVFASGVDFDEKGATEAQRLSADIEIDTYGGIKPKWRDVTFDFGFIYYAYNDKRSTIAREQDYVELKAGASVTVLKDVGLGLTYFYSPDTQGLFGEAHTLEGTVSKPLFTYDKIGVAASGTVGGVWYEKPLQDYIYWNAGATVTIYEKFSVDFRYWDTDLKEGVDLPCGIKAFQCGESFAVTGKVSF